MPTDLPMGNGSPGSGDLRVLNGPGGVSASVFFDPHDRKDEGPATHDR